MPFPKENVGIGVVRRLAFEDKSTMVPGSRINVAESPSVAFMGLEAQVCALVGKKSNLERVQRM
jgi:hypothetical protein